MKSSEIFLINFDVFLIFFRAVFTLTRGVNAKKPCICCFIPRKMLTDITNKFRQRTNDKCQEVYNSAITSNTKKEAKKILKRKGLRMVNVSSNFFKFMRSLY